MESLSATQRWLSPLKPPALAGGRSHGERGGAGSREERRLESEPMEEDRGQKLRIFIFPPLDLREFF